MSHDFPTSKHETRIEDVPPKRNRDFADLLHALFAVLVGAAVILFSIYLHGTTSGVESDVRSAGHVVSWLMDVPTSLLQQIAIVFITVSVLIQLLIAKEWLQSVVSAIALILGFAAIWGISALISGSGNDTLIMSMMSNGTSVGTGLLPDFYAAMASFLTVADRVAPVPAPMGLEHPLHGRRAVRGAVMEFAFRRAGLLCRGTCLGHADPFHARHTDQRSLGATRWRRRSVPSASTWRRSPAGSRPTPIPAC